MQPIYLFLVLILLILLISMIPLKFQIRYFRKNHDDELVIKVYIVKWLGFRLEFPMIKLEHYLLRPHLKLTSKGGINSFNLAKDKERLTFPELERLPRVLRIIYNKLKLYKPVLIYSLSKVRFREIKWETKFGSKDPVETGIITGVIWAFKNMAYSKLDQYVQIKKPKPRFQVIPYFNQFTFSSDIYCIFDIRIGHIIITGINFLKRTFIRGGKN